VKTSEDIKGGTGDMAFIESGTQRDLIDQSAARAIDDSNPALGQRECTGIDDVLVWSVNAYAR
jgi:hypothetical protein